MHRDLSALEHLCDPFEENIALQENWKNDSFLKFGLKKKNYISTRLNQQVQICWKKKMKLIKKNKQYLHIFVILIYSPIMKLIKHKLILYFRYGLKMIKNVCCPSVILRALLRGIHVTSSQNSQTQ